MQEFNWEECEKIRGKDMADFFKRVSGMKISEEDFVKEYQKIPRKNGMPKRGTRSPYRGRMQYRNLKRDFGFFTP